MAGDPITGLRAHPSTGSLNWFFRYDAHGRFTGYPVLQHINRLIDGEIIWAPAIKGGFVLSTRGGDFELDLGQDISIGYLSHSETSVRLYLQESFTFRLRTTEAAVALLPATGA